MTQSCVVVVSGDQLVLLSNVCLSGADGSPIAVVSKGHALENHLAQQVVKHDVQNAKCRAHENVSLALLDEVIQELNFLDIEVDFRVG